MALRLACPGSIIGPVTTRRARLPGDDLCVAGLQLTQTLFADVCLDLTDDRCHSDADCAADEYCTLFYDKERPHQVCWMFPSQFGTPTTRRRVGEACDSRAFWDFPCETAADCPAGWACTARVSDGRRNCQPPAAETCSFTCLRRGVCSGLCETDADCPETMRCSHMRVPWGDQGTDWTCDDVAFDVSFCMDAAGSGTPCEREADCATTGAGGAAEVCSAMPGPDGTPTSLCVTPAPFFVAANEECGDDPATEAVEFRWCEGPCVSTCSGRCASDADCPADHDCVPLKVDDEQSADFCLRHEPCTTSEDCAADEVCSLWYTTDEQWLGCAAALGERAPGAVCPVQPLAFSALDERCRRGCVDVGLGEDEGRCAALCATDADCPADFLCATEAFARENRGTLDPADDDLVTFDACAFLPGSGTECGRPADCPDGETCLAFFSAAGEPTAVCSTGAPGGAPSAIRATGTTRAPAASASRAGGKRTRRSARPPAWATRTARRTSCAAAGSDRR